MPGVLILEAMAQAAAILGFRTMQRMPDKEEMYYFAGIDNARFKKPVLPGDQLELDVELVASRRGIGKYECKARVDGALVTEAVLPAVRSSSRASCSTPNPVPSFAPTVAARP